MEASSQSVRMITLVVNIKDSNLVSEGALHRVSKHSTDLMQEPYRLHWESLN
jgi:hypothetical protein